MADGEVKCIGVSADLKHRFGEGFKVSVQVAKHHNEEPVDEFVRKLLPGATLINELAGFRNYQVAKEGVKLHEVFEQFEENKEKLHVTDWAITNTTLEEVFLRISTADVEVEIRQFFPLILISSNRRKAAKIVRVARVVMRIGSRNLMVLFLPLICKQYLQKLLRVKATRKVKEKKVGVKKVKRMKEVLEKRVRRERARHHPQLKKTPNLRRTSDLHKISETILIYLFIHLFIYSFIY